MSSNTVLNPGTGGDTIRDIDKGGGVKTPVSVIDVGGSGAEVLLSVANPMPVNVLNTPAVTVSGTVPVSGTVTANQGGSWTVALSGTSAVNLAQVGGAAFALGQTNMAGSFPVVLASNQSAIPASQSGSWTVGITGTVAATQSGTWTVNQGGSWTVATNADATIGGTTAPSKLLFVGGKTADVTPQYQPLPLTAGGAAVKTDGSATTQPVSGTFWQATQPVSGTVSLSGTSAVNLSQVGGSALALGQTNMTGSIPVVLASNQSAIPVSQSGSWTVSITGTTTVSGTITANQGGAPWAQNVTQWNGTTVDTNSGVKSAGTLRVVLATDQPSLTNAQPVSQSGTWNVTVNTALPAGANTIGAVTQASGPWTSNVTQFGGSNVVTGTGASGAGVPRVTVANDSNVLATQSGTWTVQQGGAPWSVSQSGTWNVTVNTALPAGTNQIGHVILDASASGTGLSTDFASALSTTVRAVKASSGRLYGVQVQNPNSTDCWVQLFDLATGSITLGTTTPKKSLFVPALGEIALDWPFPIAFATAISCAATTTATGNTAPTTGLVWNADYL